MLTRRNFLRTASGLLVAAPMVVQASSLMKIFVPKKEELIQGEIGFFSGCRFTCEYTDHEGVIRHETISADAVNFIGDDRLDHHSIILLEEDYSVSLFEELMGTDVVRPRLGRRSFS